MNTGLKHNPLSSSGQKILRGQLLMRDCTPAFIDLWNCLCFKTALCVFYCASPHESLKNFHHYARDSYVFETFNCEETRPRFMHSEAAIYRSASKHQ